MDNIPKSQADDLYKVGGKKYWDEGQDLLTTSEYYDRRYNKKKSWENDSKRNLCRDGRLKSSHMQKMKCNRNKNNHHRGQK